MTTFNWPEDAAVAVSLTFDVDAESGFLGDDPGYARRLTSLSEGRFGVTRGLPRILDLLEKTDTRASFFVPGHTAATYPDVIPSIIAGNHEIGHHGHMHLRTDKVSEQDQRDEIEKGFEALEAAGAPRPVGYRSPAWEVTPETFRMLIEAGFEYESSCMGDDRPYVETHDGQSLLEMPVHWSLDDWPRFGWSIDLGGNVGSANELFDSWVAEYRSAREEGRHVSFTMHPEVIGRAYRFKVLEDLIDVMKEDGDVWMAPLADVARHVRPTMEEFA